VVLDRQPTCTGAPAGEAPEPRVFRLYLAGQPVSPPWAVAASRYGACLDRMAWARPEEMPQPGRQGASCCAGQLIRRNAGQHARVIPVSATELAGRCGPKSLPACPHRDISWRVEVMNVAGLTKHEARPADLFSQFDQMFDQWLRTGPLRPMNMPQWLPADDLIRLEEFREDGALVVRAELPGIDPDRDVELTVSDGMLHIRAERRAEEKREEHGFLRQELRYGSLSRSIPLGGGVTESDIKATYKAGMLEIRIPEPKSAPAKKIPIASS
jgi:HSP20 family protein